MCLHIVAWLLVENNKSLQENGFKKVEEKQPVVDLDKVKETFMHAHMGFCIPDLPSSKGKEPQIPDRSMELWSDSNASTSTTMCQESEPTSKIKSFLQSYLKPICDENV